MLFKYTKNNAKFSYCSEKLEKQCKMMMKKYKIQLFPIFSKTLGKRKVNF